MQAASDYSCQAPECLIKLISLTFAFLMSEIEQFLIYLRCICISFSVNCFFTSFINFLLAVCGFRTNFYKPLDSREIGSWLVVKVASIFSGLSFDFVMVLSLLIFL